MLRIETHYYIQATFGNGYDIIHGHTTNPWLAKRFYDSLGKNTIYLESYSTPEEARQAIVFMEYTGTVHEFHEEVDNIFDVPIDGEDIITVFETEMLSDKAVALLPKARVLSTSAEIFGGTFISFAERFMLPVDVIEMKRSMQKMETVLTFVQPSAFLPDKVAAIVLLFEMLAKHPLFSENSPPFIQEMTYTDNAIFDIVRYGIAKGWYCPI